MALKENCYKYPLNFLLFILSTPWRNGSHVLYVTFMTKSFNLDEESFLPFAHQVFVKLQKGG